MFIKNKTKTYQSFMLAGTPFRMAPNETLVITEKQAQDPVISLLISRECIKELDTEKGIDAMAQAAKEQEEIKAQKPKIEVMESTKDEMSTQDVVQMVQCAATKANGEHCTTQVSVPIDDFSADKPYFCGRHKNENSDNYEKINGVWVEKQNPEQTNENEE